MRLWDPLSPKTPLKTTFFTCKVASKSTQSTWHSNWHWRILGALAGTSLAGVCSCSSSSFSNSCGGVEYAARPRFSAEKDMRPAKMEKMMINQWSTNQPWDVGVPRQIPCWTRRPSDLRTNASNTPPQRCLISCWAHLDIIQALHCTAQLWSRVTRWSHQASLGTILLSFSGLKMIESIQNIQISSKDVVVHQTNWEPVVHSPFQFFFQIVLGGSVACVRQESVEKPMSNPTA